MDEIERCQAMGPDALLEEDQCLLEVNLGDLESSSGKRQEHWLLAIEAAWRAKVLGSQASQTAEHGVGEPLLGVEFPKVRLQGASTERVELGNGIVISA